MEDAVEMKLHARTYIPSFIRIGSGIEKLIRLRYRDKEGDRISQL
jgi:hypothetical protein